MAVAVVERSKYELTFGPSARTKKRGLVVSEGSTVNQ